jgi:hypothetical protein
MKRVVELISQRAQNFQGVKEYSLNLNGASATVSAPNGVGKTTLASMYSWPIFGCDATGNAKNDVAKPLDKDMKPVHNLDTVVEIVLRVDGELRTFKRLFKEDWKTKAGASVAELKSHTNSYWVNGVPFGTEREFQAELNKVIPLDVWPCMSNPQWFLSEKMKDTNKTADARRREVLLQLCGDVTEQAVIDATPKLSDLSKRGSRTVADWHKMQKAGLKDSGIERDSLPGLISENALNLSEIPEGDHIATLAKRQVAVQELRDRKAQLSSGGEVARIEVLLAGIESALIRRRSELTSRRNPERDFALAVRRQRTEVKTEMEANLRKQMRELFDINADLASFQRQREQKLTEAKAIKARLDQMADEKFMGATLCPGCGRDLPEDQLQAASEAFNAQLAQRRERLQGEFDAIVAVGRSLRVKIDAITGKDEMAGTLGVAEGTIRDTEAEIARLQAEIDDAVVPEAETLDLEQDGEVIRLVADRSAKQAEIATLRTGSQEAADKLDAQIKSAESLVAESQGVLAQIASNVKTRERIAVHEARQNEITSVLEEQSRQIWLCEQYLMAHVAMSEDKINSQFEIVRWKLFDVQLNEGIKPCCIPTIKGSSNLSTGEKILAGLDICKFFQNRYETICPVWVDYSESFTGEFPMPGQTINLVAVKGAPRVLKVVLEPLPMQPVAKKAIPTEPLKELETALF